jgi:hypothetical protein
MTSRKARLIGWVLFLIGLALAMPTFLARSIEIAVGEAFTFTSFDLAIGFMAVGMVFTAWSRWMVPRRGEED